MNVFVTVGTQLPFDRLIRYVDIWRSENPNSNAFAQIGKSEYIPRSLDWATRISAKAFDERFAWADVVVAHAGVGTLLAAIDAGKPLIVVPRQAALNEHRNDHQLATAKRIAERELAYVAHDHSALDALLSSAQALRPCYSDLSVSPQLIDRVNAFISSTAA
jgi:UDP-N-acetylglucosamine transferase subunit ALG13